MFLTMWWLSSSSDKTRAAKTSRLRTVMYMVACGFVVVTSIVPRRSLMVLKNQKIRFKEIYHFIIMQFIPTQN